MAENSSDEDADLLQTFKNAVKPPAKPKDTPVMQKFKGVRVTPVADRSAYEDAPASVTVERILEEIHREDNELEYRVQFDDGTTKIVTYEDIDYLEGGGEALAVFESFAQNSPPSSDSYSEPELAPRVTERRRGRPAAGSSSKGSPIIVDSSEDDELEGPAPRRRTAARVSGGHATRKTRSGGRSATFYELDASSSTSSEAGRRYPKRRSAASFPEPRRSTRQYRSESDDGVQRSSDSDDNDIIRSDVRPSRKRKREPESKPYRDYNNRSSNGTRTSKRTTRHTDNMAEAGLEDVYRSDSDRPRVVPKPATAKESFKQLARDDPFAVRHVQQCDTCGNREGPQGHLIHCQGCTLSYHKICLGNRGTRDHLVTKVGHSDFVLQCRRCTSSARRRDLNAPDQAMCQTCRETGVACAPFRPRKMAATEEKEREANGGSDPIVAVDPSLINNVNNVMFRCSKCWRAYHFHHLVSKNDMMDVGEDEIQLAEKRFFEYASTWTCRDCSDMPAKVSTIVAWRPIDADTYSADTDTTEVAEDAKEYLIKWDQLSYYQAQWMPGAWTWGVTAAVMRKAFAKRNNDTIVAITKTEDAIPEEYLRIDIVLDIKFTSFVETRAEEVDKARIREVDKALTKYKGLGYEDAVWEKVPGPDDGDRWTDFVKAYDDWVAGRYIRVPKGTPLKARLEKARSTEFTLLEKKVQPPSLTGGELMKYQLDGVNWLYYRWHQRKNAILADEMGLGKTIQIIGLLTLLLEDHNCFPFLLVVPNSTCPNWRREIKQWAPSLRVVTYFGSSQARAMATKYELFPEGSDKIRCHVVVTSYEAAADDKSRKFLKSVPWQGLIVDEGQRLKSDKSILYDALRVLKIPFTCLLTGTPLQNNARELFNLLQFLDGDFDAAALELEYAELTKQNIPQLHNLIRPFFLRRTKAEVLTFLPPMGQVIIPVTMSVVQRKLYKTILAKNPELLRAIFNHERNVAKTERANLNNLLMQLRKCLCHPFVYSQDIEERNVSPEVSHRNLVEASPKLQLLELLLPKLKARGSRVLIFSQFLNMLDIIEDFLDGLGFNHQRLDGSTSSLQKQKRIDEFNAPNSQLFAFLLSTQAGGVGINLATADTVIIMDPDFNPHRDIQALSRAHRIGQKRKVLCFQLMTQASAEEKIVQIGRKKMALDHVLIDQMDADADSAVDMESILRFGATEVLEDDSTRDIRYDDASVDKLLDRSLLEDTKAGADQTAESQFSFARVWANDAASMNDSLGSDDDGNRVPDPGVWKSILQERERLAAEEAARRQEVLGRGKRARQTVDYSGDVPRQGDDTTPQKQRGRPRDSDSDTDFQAQDRSDEESAEEEPEDAADVALDAAEVREPTKKAASPPPPPVSKKPQPRTYKTFNRSNVIWTHDTPHSLPPNAPSSDQQNPPPLASPCYACSGHHHRGYCPFKLAGPEYCNLCGLAHYGEKRTCPHIKSETQVRAMLAALKQSPENKTLVAEAVRYLNGVKGTLAQAKRIKAQKAIDAANVASADSMHAQRMGLGGSGGGIGGGFGGGFGGGVGVGQSPGSSMAWSSNGRISHPVDANRNPIEVGQPPFPYNGAGAPPRQRMGDYAQGAGPRPDAGRNVFRSVPSDLKKPAQQMPGRSL